jgi:hypothetical protein
MTCCAITIEDGVPRGWSREVAVQRIEPDLEVYTLLLEDPMNRLGLDRLIELGSIYGYARWPSTWRVYLGASGPRARCLLTPPLVQTGGIVVVSVGRTLADPGSVLVVEVRGGGAGDVAVFSGGYRSGGYP